MLTFTHELTVKIKRSRKFSDLQVTALIRDNKGQRYWETSVGSRQTLLEPFVWLTSRITQPPTKSSSSTVLNSELH
ncbi:hypothetical protein KUTeg_019659 [Tegillarca granosa]|uniref:Uncharacterized protein n=1 Tax=Tegillarca granosa TaxID=220873 RepID=A0ABQ9ED90_TEGGR|nr:hypothetical protein KUTeg_019659 [Tegillarca granosa]